MSFGGAGWAGDLVDVRSGGCDLHRWIGAIVNTADLPSKTWLVVELVLGLLGFAFVGVLA